MKRLSDPKYTIKNSLSCEVKPIVIRYLISEVTTLPYIHILAGKNGKMIEY